MKTVKKSIALLLAVVMVFSMAVTAFAFSVKPEFSTTTVKAGESVTVTLKLNDTIPAVTGFDCRVYFNPELFTLTSSENGDVRSEMQISVKAMLDLQKRPYYTVNYIDPTSEGQPMPAGTLYTLVFTAKEDLTEDTEALFEVKMQDVTDGDIEPIPDATVTDGLVTVTITANKSEETPEQPVAGGYTVSISGDKQVAVGETASVDVFVNSDSVETYNAYDLTMTYDTENLTYVSGEGADPLTTITEQNGTIRILGCGDDKAVGTKVATLNFTPKKAAAAAVQLTAAKIDMRENANLQDTPSAVISGTGSSTITGSVYQVSLGEGLRGEATAVPKQDYTFAATDAEHYDYAITAKVNGQEVAVTDNGDGTYTIPGASVTGNLDITAVMTAKQYKVTVDGTGKDDVTAAAQASYNTDYTFTVDQKDNYTYAVAVTIDGEAYTGYTAENGAYTIPGKDICGNITIQVDKTKIPAAEHKVTFEGTGAGDAAGAASVEDGADYTFTVNEEAGYDYNVTATMGGQTAVVSGDNGSYKIQKVTGDLVITVTKTAQSGGEEDVKVAVNEYIKLDSTSMWLVQVSGVPEGNVAQYDGKAMYWSEQYDAYTFLVISDKALDVVEADAAAKVTTAAGEAAGTVDYSGDVNGTKVIDVNDAQLTYNMYNAVYADFQEVSMLKFLNADVNGDQTVNVQDAAAIVELVVNP